MYETPDCPACDDLEIPETTNNCVPESNESEICYVFISRPSTADPNVPEITSPDFSSPAIATTFVTPDGAMLRCIGDLPEPEDNQRTVSLGQIVPGKKSFAPNITIDDTSDLNYEFLRMLECAPSVFIWYMTLGGKVYGDLVNGIPATISKANAPLDRGQGNYERFEIVPTWRAKGHPPRQNGWLFEENNPT